MPFPPFFANYFGQFFPFLCLLFLSFCCCLSSAADEHFPNANNDRPTSDRSPTTTTDQFYPPPPPTEIQISFKRPYGGPPYTFIGKKIAGEPDSKIYKVSRFLSGIWPPERPGRKPFAVKVVSTGIGARLAKLAKPAVMIRHELFMLEAFNAVQRNQPPGEHCVVKLFGGGVVVDKSAMVVKRDGIPFHVDLSKEMSMIYVMEWGDATLDKHLEQLGDVWRKQWEAEEAKFKPAKWNRKHQPTEPLIRTTVEQQLVDLLKRLAATLSGFHKYALHLHLKPGNWIHVQSEHKWKFIDLQSAIPNLHLSNDVRESESMRQFGFVREQERLPEDLVEFACNSLSNEIFLTPLIAKANERPTTYASPEHIDACQRAHPLLLPHNVILSRRETRHRVLEKELRRIGPKADVWSFGVLMLEILAHTPQLNPSSHFRLGPIEVFVKLRAEFVSDLLPREHMGATQHLEEFAHFRRKRKRIRIGGGKKLDIKMGKFMERIQQHFPAVFMALLRIFVKDPAERAELGEVLNILNGGRWSGELSMHSLPDSPADRSSSDHPSI